MIGKVTVTAMITICMVMLIDMGQCNPVIGKKYGNSALFIFCFRFKFIFTLHNRSFYIQRFYIEQ